MAVVVANDSNFSDLIQKNSKVVVKYYADWCGACKMFAPKYRRISEEELYQEILFLDVNAEENPEARHAAGVDNLPYLAVFKDGKLLEGGASGKEEYLRKLLTKLSES
ncbi:thioredoxin family protein [Schleiferia thermophila]|jgi:thioredoxin-like negative regulator of GroEL|uniref:Thioredoxin n=1 Tax=Schleiferia thermophila TaxID=884107 RepID=A0A369A7Z6_9FLAO|nr:thioredoxin family protein [Schleiferia thermophila]KFD39992.1 thioredoxin [Schleiferia thermophila str. Yellowstone]RCX05429.1 thioredoxin [Schleiferia thermophila]GCD79068.1 thioredoxin [Schleiferia thermophila]